VEAGLVSPVVVIIVALTGVAAFAIPHVSLVFGFRLIKYLILILSAFLGFLGFWSGLLLTLTHMASLNSFNIPYLMPFAASEMCRYEDVKDSLFRLPLFTLRRRPFFARRSQRIRQGANNDAVR
jgi:spore germination protein